MTGATVLTRFTADTKDFDSKTKSVNASISSIAKGVVAATGVTKALGAAWNLVTGSMDTAIDRYDTLQNFTKVMKNLGIGTEESQQAIDKMADKLMGLPTTLQDGAIAVQRLTAKNGDIKRSTDLFLAMNNAILAGGAPLANQQAALEQLTQAYSKGRMDMMEWRTLQTAMPAQLKQVATAMGMTTEELGVMMRQGDMAQETVEKFANTMVELNTKGAEGFSNLEEQARSATGGIRTALVNLNTRVAIGVTAMIDGVNKGLAEANLGSIASIFDDIGNAIKEGLKALTPYITDLVIKLSQVAIWINKNQTWLKAILVPLIAFITTFSLISKIISIVKGVTTAISVLNAVLLANPIVLIIAGIVALVAAFIYLWNHCEGFRNFWIGLWEGIVNAAVNAWKWLQNTFNIIINFIKNNWQGLLLLLVNPFWGAFKLIYDNCAGFRNFINSFVSTIINFFKRLPGELFNVGKNMIQGLINGIKNVKQMAINAVRNIGSSILNGIKSVLGIHSPSTEFALIGKYSVLGYTEGLEKMDREVKDQIAETFALSPELLPNNSLHYTPNVQVYNNVDIKSDPLGQMVSNIKTFSGGAKNDYNYGAGV